MQYLSDVGFVIKRTNFGEADRYVTVYSRNNGKVELVAKGVRKISSRRASHIELLHLIKFQSVRGKNSYILTEAELMHGFHDSQISLEQLSCRFLLCELIDKLCPANQHNTVIFDILQETLTRLEAGDTGKNMQDFQVNLLTNLGYWDDTRKFYDEHDMRNFIETIIEKRLKTKLYFEF